MHVYLWYTNVSMFLVHQWNTSVSSTSTTGALDDFDKTSVPPMAPEAPTAPDAGTSDEKVKNTCFYIFIAIQVVTRFFQNFPALLQ